MKNWTFKVVMMACAVVLTSACSKKGSNNAAAAPAAAGVCTIGANGLCVGQTAYTGSGRWTGHLNVVPAQLALYRQFLMEQGLCHTHCGNPTSFVGISIRVNGGSQGRVTITPYEYSGWSRNRLTRNANVTSANIATSFNMVVIDTNQYFAPNINTIQLSNTFVTPYGNVITTTLFYRGIPIATGQLNGQRNDYYGNGIQPQQAPSVAPYNR